METEALNLEMAGEKPDREKVMKKKRRRVRLDSGIKKAEKRQKILTIAVVLFMGVALLAAFVLYKMDQSSAAAQTEFVPPSGG